MLKISFFVIFACASMAFSEKPNSSETMVRPSGDHHRPHHGPRPSHHPPHHGPKPPHHGPKPPHHGPKPPHHGPKPPHHGRKPGRHGKRHGHWSPKGCFNRLSLSGKIAVSVVGALVFIMTIATVVFCCK